MITSCCNLLHFHVYLKASFSLTEALTQKGSTQIGSTQNEIHVRVRLIPVSGVPGGELGEWMLAPTIFARSCSSKRQENEL